MQLLSAYGFQSAAVEAAVRCCVFLCCVCCSLLAGVPVVYTGDPLRDLGLTAFLDKFVNKKPKVGRTMLVAG